MPPLPGDVQWFPAEIRRLILAIKKNEGIYNPRHEHFGLREMQTKAWKAVAQLVGGGKTDSQCRDKWNCLRGTYRRHVRTEATNNVKRRSGWPWAEMMSFIRHFVMEKEDLPEPKPSQNRTKSPPTKTKTHMSHCPSNHVKAVNITTSSPSSGTGPPGLIFTSNNPQHIIYTNRVLMSNQSQGIGILQPNKGVNILQSGQPVRLIQHNHQGVNILQSSPRMGSIGVRLLRPAQPTVGMALVRQPTQPTVTQSSQKPLGIAVKTPEQMQSVNVNVESPLELDLSQIKPDPDAPSSPDRPEFVDMDLAVKSEPMDEEIEFTEEFNFLSEDNSQETAHGNDEINENEVESGKKSNDESNSLPSPQRNPLELEVIGVEGSEGGDDSNELFMRSTVAHMKQLSPYEQSAFKMKVQQLLHDMMFPQTSK